MGGGSWSQAGVGEAQKSWAVWHDIGIARAEEHRGIWCAWYGRVRLSLEEEAGFCELWKLGRENRAEKVKSR